MNLREILTKEIVEPEWVVKDMIPRGYMVILAGEAGAGKSYLMYYLTYAVASGQPFLGFPTRPTKILYFDEENSLPDFLQYNQWAWRAHGTLDPEILEPNLRIEHNTLLGGWIGPMSQALKEFKPGLVIIDTATPAFHLEDENDNAEANQVIRELRRMKANFCSDATFIVLKHEKQRDDVGHRRTIRGAKTWLGAFDQTLYHVRLRGRPRKNGLKRTALEPDKSRAFGLRFSVGIDPAFDGDERKCLILNPFGLQDQEEQPREE